ncbi:MAG: hypothetical protein AAGE92_11530 [Cyanobacteria bacterium P01_G01_bin.4]
MTATQKPETNTQSVKSNAHLEEGITIFASCLNIEVNQLDLPENAITKTIVCVYAEKLAAGGDKQKLKKEFIALFNNSPGRYALELAQNASNGAGELARDAGRKVGKTLKSDMRTQFNEGVREGMAAETEEAPDLIALGKSQVDTYFARLEGGKETKRLGEGT